MVLPLNQLPSLPQAMSDEQPVLMVCHGPRVLSAYWRAMLVAGMPYAPGMVLGSPRQPLKLSFQYWLSDVEVRDDVGIWTD